MTGERVICVSSIDWDAKWQGHQEIATALASAGNRVLFVENTGVRAPRLEDAPRFYKRIRDWGRGYGMRTEREGLQVHSPLLLPFPYSRVAQRFNGARLERTCRAWSSRAGGPHPILLTFLPTPIVSRLVRALRPELTIYYCVDDLRSSSAGALRIGDSEADLMRTADLVFVTADGLRERAARIGGDVHLLPSGVNFANFDRVRTGAASLPAEIRSLTGPVVGYLGGIDQRTDDELLVGVARRMPDVQFVILGPVPSRAGVLADLPNVHLLGQRPHVDIPHYLKGFAAGIIPYRITEYTSHIYPAKLNEYLAMGLPVVSTPLPELRRFNDAHGGLIAIADGADAFAAAVRLAIDAASPMDTRRRIAVAHSNRWELKIAAMTDLVAQALAEKRGMAPSPGAVPGARTRRRA